MTFFKPKGLIFLIFYVFKGMMMVRSRRTISTHLHRFRCTVKTQKNKAIKGLARKHRRSYQRESGLKNGSKDSEIMPRHRLTDAQCRSATKDLYDGRGLILRVDRGSKSWGYRYQLRKMRTTIGLGPYPAISLAAARERHREAETLVKQGIHPNDHWEAQRRRGAPLREVAEDYLKTKQKLKRGGVAGRWMSPLETHVFPDLGDLPIVDLTVDNISDALRPIWQDKHPTAVKALTRLGQIIRWTGGRDTRIDVNLSKRVAENLGEVAHKVEHHRAMHWDRAPAAYAMVGSSTVQLALRFYMLTCVRVQNVTRMTWDEIEGDVWYIPAERMKTEAPFRVPLSAQAKEVLARVGGRTSDGYVFPSTRAYKKGLISENAFNKWFKDNDWPTTAHGWRSTFREWCVHEGVDDYLAEVCLQHEKRQKTVAAYQREDRLNQRMPVMQNWSDFLTDQTAEDRADILDMKPRRRRAMSEEESANWSRRQSDED